MIKQAVLISVLAVIGSNLSIEDTSVHIKITMNSLYALIASLGLILLYQMKTKARVRQHQIEPPQIPTDPWIDDVEPILKKTSLIETDNDLDSRISLQKSTHSLQEDDSQSTDEIKRSYSLGERRSRKVSFDESHNKVHVFKKNEKKEIKNYELSTKELKTERKKKNEAVKQKRKEENLKKLTINDICKKQRKRKSSYDDQGSV